MAADVASPLACRVSQVPTAAQARARPAYARVTLPEGTVRRTPIVVAVFVI